jgi:hypothetical protein
MSKTPQLLSKLVSKAFRFGIIQPPQPVFAGDGGTAQNLKIYLFINILISDFGFPRRFAGRTGRAQWTRLAQLLLHGHFCSRPGSDAKDVFIEPDHDLVRPTLRDSH